MNRYRLLGVLFAGIALALIYGCGGGLLGQSATDITTPGQGEAIGEMAGGGDYTLATDGASICEAWNIMPAGKQAYITHFPNEIFDSRTPFLYPALMDTPILGDSAGVLRFGDWQYGSQEGNVWAMTYSVLGDMMTQAIGTGLPDIECTFTSLNYRLQNLCPNDSDPACFNKLSVIAENLDNVPIIGQIIGYMMQMIPDQYASSLNLLEYIPTPDPLAFYAQTIEGAEIQTIVWKWNPGSLANLREYMDWALPRIGDYLQQLDQLLQPAMMNDNLAIPPPNFSTRAAMGIVWEEDDDNCIRGTVVADQPPASENVLFGKATAALDGFSLVFCEYESDKGGFLTISTDASSDQMKMYAENYVGGAQTNVFTNDDCYIHSYLSLRPLDTDEPVPDLMTCGKFHEMQSTLVPIYNSASQGEPGEPPGILGPLVMAMPLLNRDIDEFMVGTLISIDYKSRIRVSVKLWEEIAELYSLNKEMAPADGRVGAYDFMIDLGGAVSSNLTDAINMDFYFGAENTVYGIDIYDFLSYFLLMQEDMFNSFMQQR